MSVDLWIGRTDQGQGVANPTWQQVVQAIAALDGNTRTIVSISEREGSSHHMVIAGKWNGLFLVYMTRNNLAFITLTDPTKSEAKLRLFVGGQYGEYAERVCVPEQWALQAAKEFFESGEPERSLHWTSSFAGLLRVTLECFVALLGGRPIGRTPDSGSGYPGSSPGLPANLFNLCALEFGIPEIERSVSDI